VTDSGYIGAHVQISSLLPGELETAAIRWRNGVEDQFGIPDGENLRPVISERGEFATDHSVLVDDEWQVQEADVLAVGPYGESWFDELGNIATDDHQYLFEKKGVKLRASLPNNSRVDYVARFYPDDGAERLISDPLIKADQTDPDPIVALDTSSNADVVGWFDSGATGLEAGTPRSFHWNSGAFTHVSDQDDGSRFLAINNSGQILAGRGSSSGSAGARQLDSGEVQYFLRQPNTDKNANGLDDDWEIKNQITDPDSSADADSLTNRQEQALGLNPNKSDSDGDEMDDGEEVLAGEDSAVASGNGPDPDPGSFLGEQLYLETRPYERWINGTEDVPGFDFYSGVQLVEKAALNNISTSRVPTTEAALNFLSQFSPPPTIKWPNLELWEPEEIFGPKYTPPYGAHEPGVFRIERYPLTGHLEEPYQFYVAYSAKAVEFDKVTTDLGSYDFMNGRTTSFEFRLVHKETTDQGEFYKTVDSTRSASFVLVRARVPISSTDSYDAVHDWEVKGTISEVLKHPEVEILDVEVKTVSIQPGNSKSVGDDQEWQNRNTVRAVMPGEVEDPNFAYYAGLLPVGVTVDYNRDGNIDDEDTSQSSESRPFSFWLNNDQDDKDYGETLPASSADSSDSQIKSIRDLEDFARLRINIGGIHEQIRSGEIKVGLKWKNITEGSPSVKIWTNMSLGGGADYLSDNATAESNIQLQNPGHVHGQ